MKTKERVAYFGKIKTVQTECFCEDCQDWYNIVELFAVTHRGLSNTYCPHNHLMEEEF